ncbi:MAG: PEGA domain-containing protein [Chitinivibrionales bacterium]|nr:PEGA domain-containing protein [Chitinivibrionales bacterium]MBD3397385.1 PEGA domain-containing protein [Chitinivibrionales bacterium]
MMDRLESQERRDSIQRLRGILREVPGPRARTEAEWRSVENAVFSSLDRDTSQAGKAVVLERGFAFRSFTRPLIAAAAALTVIVNAFVLLRHDPVSPARSLQNSKILYADGSVAMGDDGAVAPLRDIDQNAYQVKAGDRYETGDDGSLMMQLVEGTGIRLSRNTRLEVLVASAGRIELMLHYGDVLFSVRPLERGSQFVVQTPNAECRVVGTIFQVTASPEGGQTRTDLAVYQGAVRITDSEQRRVSASVETGRMVSLYGHRFEDVFSAAARQSSIRDISLLKLALDLARDTLASPAGMIELTSEPPEARVVINGEFMGTTPMVATYPAGTYDVSLSRHGFKPWHDSVTVNPMRANVVTAELAPAEARARSVPDPAARRNAALEPSDDEIPKDFVNRPEYVEALIQMTIGEYRKALGILESLKEQPELSARDRAYVMEKISHCYRSLGDFRGALRVLRREHRRATDLSAKANFLWEMATVKATCLGDYKSARRDLEAYLEMYPDGPWAAEAVDKLAELQVLIELSSK